MFPWLLRISLVFGLLVAQSGWAQPEKLDLNLASQTELTRLPGIGPKRAQAIIKRRSRRRYRRLRELLAIRGIGPKTLKRLKPLLKITKSPPK